MKVNSFMLSLLVDASRIRRAVVNQHVGNLNGTTNNTTDDEDPSFGEWAGQYGFNSDDTEMAETYQANLDKLAKVRADHSEAKFGVNQFSGLTWEQFSSTMLTSVEDPLANSDMPLLESQMFEGSQAELATDVDWEVTPVKNQGACGSCWAFGTMASIEHGHKLKTGATVSLAEQQLVDCEKESKGCNGGHHYWGLTYLTDKPIFTTESYPYKAREGSCTTGTDSGVRISGFTRLPKQDENALLQALQKQAVSVSVGADDAFTYYKSGVINGHTDCKTNHAVLATGYNSEYIKIKNSWGTAWGEAGYIRVKRSTDGCGPFALMATPFNAFPVMAASV